MIRYMYIEINLFDDVTYTKEIHNLQNNDLINIQFIAARKIFLIKKAQPRVNKIISFL